MPPLEDIPEEGVITFPEGVPGLTSSTRFVIMRPEDMDPILVLQNVEDENVSLPLIPVHAVIRDYSLKLSGRDREVLGLSSGAEQSRLLCLAVLILPGARRPAACNLFAPLVINPATLLAKQVAQLSSDYPSLHSLGGE